MGWLGYFIGKSRCLQNLFIRAAQRRRGEQQTRALFDGIARNHSIRSLDVNADDRSDEEFLVICAGILINLSQLVVLHLGCDHYLGFDGHSFCSALRSGTTKLKELSLAGNIGDIGVASLEHGFARIGPFLKTLDLRCNSIGNDGLMAVVEH